MPLRVDRSRFLLLTASLAAAACNQPQPAASPDTGGADPARSDAAGQTGATADGSGAAIWLEIEPGTEDRPTQLGDGSCDNAIGSPRICTLSPPAGHCESFDMTQQLCAALPEVMQPRAAEAAVDCMLAASGTQRVCDWDFSDECVGAGMQASCVEPATRAECDSISSQCGGSLDVFSCQTALSSVVPRYQGRVASCISEFCSVSSWCLSDVVMF